jgi:glycerophosphoryl diester phosphodiesterase
MQKTPEFDVQGHRGCMGYMPENSIPGFLKAIDMGVNTLEMDVVISKDSQVVVSHDPFFNPAICLTPDGNPISPGNHQTYNLFKMTYREIRAFDCGSAGNKLFPDQKKVISFKPLLRDVLTTCENYCRDRDLPPVKYNIEIKRKKENDNLFHPGVRVFCDLVIGVILEFQIDDRISIQSFDVETLQIFRNQYPSFPLAYLVDNGQSLDENLKVLGFHPEIYSPNYITIDRHSIQSSHLLGIKIIPWTVNHRDHIYNLVKWGVDGIITDYPDRVLSQIP